MASRLLKADLFGTVTLMHADANLPARVIRDTRPARWWVRHVSRLLMRREARALRRLSGIGQVPACLAVERDCLTRAFIEGEPMQRARPHEARYFREASRLVRRLHAARVAHNDLAKEPNWLVTPAGSPALVDFQLASVSARRGRLFRALAHDDLRHMLKHKRTYVPHLLTARERRVLARRSVVARVWMATGKPVYRFVTRGVLGWADREGAGDRRFR